MQEVRATRDIGQRGVLMVGTAHGHSLSSLLANRELSDLVGGVTGVTLGDAEASRSNNGVKTRLERAGTPAFTALVEVQAENRWASLGHESSITAMGHIVIVAYCMSWSG